MILKKKKIKQNKKLIVKSIKVKPLKKKSRKKTSRRSKLLRPIEPRPKKVRYTYKKGEVIKSNVLRTKINTVSPKLRQFTSENNFFSKFLINNDQSVSAISSVESQFDYRLNILVKANNVFCNFSSFNKKFYKRNLRQYKVTCTSGKYKIRMSKGNKRYVYNQVVTKFMKGKIRPIFLRKLKLKQLFRENKFKRYSKNVKKLNKLALNKPILRKRSYLLHFLVKELLRNSKKKVRPKFKLLKFGRKVRL